MHPHHTHTTVLRRFKFAAAHRLLGHQGPCRYLHGHNFIATVALQGQKLNQLGMLVDFQVVKETIGHWIKTQWDHNIILHEDDPLLEANEVYTQSGRPSFFQGKPPYIMAKNPTCENLANELAYHVDQLLTNQLFSGLSLSSVSIEETDGNGAIDSWEGERQ